MNDSEPSNQKEYARPKEFHIAAQRLASLARRKRPLECKQDGLAASSEGRLLVGVLNKGLSFPKKLKVATISALYYSSKQRDHERWRWLKALARTLRATNRMPRCFVSVARGDRLRGDPDPSLNSSM